MKRLFVFIATLLMAAVMMTAQDGTRKYGIKSGTVKAVMDMMGQKVETTSWFDDYGALEASVTKMGGMEITTISKGGKSWMVNPSVKMVQEVPVQESVNYLDLTDEAVQKYKVKEMGKETLLNRECTTYSLEVSQMGQTAKLRVSVWEGYPLKAVTEAMGSTVTVTVTKFVEGPVESEVFEIPEY